MQKHHLGAAGLLVATGMLAELLTPISVLADCQSQQLYVSPTGSDTNTGTSQAPFRTIPKAASVAVPGTIINVAPGIYDGGFRTVASGTATAPIQYRSGQRWGAKLVPPHESKSEMAWDNRGDYVTIEGFEVDGTVTLGGTPWTIGIYAAGSHDIVMRNLVHNIGRDLPCISHGGSGIGSDHYYYGIANNVIGNIVHSIGPGNCAFFHGIYISTSGDVINNAVHNIAFAGIHLWHDATNVNIINNTVSNTEIGIFVGGGDQYHSKSPNDFTKVINNIVVKSRIAGIIEHGNTGSHNVYRRNLTWENGNSDYRLQNGLKDNQTIKESPNFLTGGTDFQLRAGSPAIDSGSAIDAPTTDIEGVSRPQGSGFDIGAYEYIPEAKSRP